MRHIGWRERERSGATDTNVTHTAGALKRVLSCLSPRETKGLLINMQLIAQQLPQVWGGGDTIANLD